MYKRQAFESEIVKCAEVLDCWLISGNFDFLLRIACESMEAYRQLAESWLSSDKFRIDKITTLAELQVVKRSLSMPAQFITE